MRALHLMIHGRVQGVWFRASAKEVAVRLGISGWVRNTPDGSVETHIQGENDAVDEMLAWCRQGPPGAYVEQVDISDTEFMKEFKAFSIRYY